MPFKGTQLHYIHPLPPTTHQHLRQRGATATHTQDNNQIHFMTPIIQVDSQSQPLQLVLTWLKPSPTQAVRRRHSYHPPTYIPQSLICPPWWLLILTAFRVQDGNVGWLLQQCLFIHTLHSSSSSSHEW